MTKDYLFEIRSLQMAKQLKECLCEKSPFYQPHFRGEQVYGWSIKPSIIRNKNEVLNGNEIRELECEAITEFKNKMLETFGVGIFKNESRGGKYGDYWDMVTLAQHAGIHTTITDWSADLMTALFFATEYSEEKEELDAQLWCFMTPKNIIRADDLFMFNQLNPFSMEHPLLYNPAHHIDKIEQRIPEQRMYNQLGRFFISETSIIHIPVEEHPKFKHLIKRFKVPQRYKENIRTELKERGIDRDFMYVKHDNTIKKIVDEINQKFSK